MSRYVLGRLAQSIPLVFAVSVIVFLVLHAAPGDPSTLLADPSFLTASERVELRAALGLEDPLPVQYVRTMAGIADGTLRSFRTKEPTVAMIVTAFPVTASVVVLGMLLALGVGVGFGAAAAGRPGGPIDRLLTASMSLAIAIPTFVLALVLIRVFAEELRVLPASGIRPIGALDASPLASLPHLVLPAVVTAFPIGAILGRYARDAIREALAEDHVRTARGKGLSSSAVLRGHVLRNALVPIVSVVGTLTPLLLGGSAIVESLFNLPGIGRITVQAALQRDYPVVMTGVLFSALLVVLGNLATDLLYGVVDPRIRANHS